jgi:hypothetical protein
MGLPFFFFPFFVLAFFPFLFFLKHLFFTSMKQFSIKVA